MRSSPSPRGRFSAACAGITSSWGTARVSLHRVLSQALSGLVSPQSFCHSHHTCTRALLGSRAGASGAAAAGSRSQRSSTAAAGSAALGSSLLLPRCTYRGTALRVPPAGGGNQTRGGGLPASAAGGYLLPRRGSPVCWGAAFLAEAPPEPVIREQLHESRGAAACWGGQNPFPGVCCSRPTPLGALGTSPRSRRAGCRRCASCGAGGGEPSG